MVTGMTVAVGSWILQVPMYMHFSWDVKDLGVSWNITVSTTDAKLHSVQLPRLFRCPGRRCVIWDK
jgi:hypothetical protein